VRRVAVVGAGLTGLAAAWELKQAGAHATVLEGERRVGGVIVTERPDGFVVEGGPDGFLAAEPEIPRLAAEVGVAGRLVRQSARGSWLLAGHALERLDEGRAAALLGIAEPAEQDLRQGFQSFAGGMGDLIDALADRLAAVVRTGSAVAGVTPTPPGYRLTLGGGAPMDVEALVLAVPAWEMARLLPGLGVSRARELAGVAYQPSLTVSLAYRAEQVRDKLEGTGFVASPESPSIVRACTYASLKYPGRAPAGLLLLRAFLGSSGGEPAALAHQELATILGIAGAPLWARSFAWARGIPRYQPGHAERVAGVRADLSRLPPIAIAGAAVDGAGVSACVRSGRQAARAVLERIGVTQPA
jgi:oxygen-dependent protoporphyrinogen oxidase